MSDLMMNSAHRLAAPDGMERGHGGSTVIAPPSKTYVVVPAAMLADRKALGGWLAVGAAQAAAAPAKKPGKTTQKPRNARV